MKQVYFYDEKTKEFNGYAAIEDTAKIPANATTVKPVDSKGFGLYDPTWNKDTNSWDSLTKEDYEQKYPTQAPKPSPEQIQLAALTKQVMQLQAAIAKADPESLEPKEGYELNEAMYTMFKAYYPLGLFTVDDCRLAVQVHYFGKKEFKEITGQDYDTPAAPIA